ncbi:hypothetical protein [Candidatus Phycosocius bacilliformis]|nr:hypothetical protein [Candidatus Phycosocius bacilliformis]
MRHLPPLPNPDRFGGPDWLSKTGGRMDLPDCAKGLLVAGRQQVANLWQRLAPHLSRPGDISAMASVPDSRLVKLAEEAALEQSPALLNHGYRSALFGRALAHIDGRAADPELLHICGILHDVGLMQAVTGEDFTLRSAAVARTCAHRAGESDLVGDHLHGALVVHTSVGVTPERDGVLGAYTQYGAMVDLTGLRLVHLPRTFVTEVLARHPRGAFKREILHRLDLEAQAVRGGRFDFARRVGFPLAVRTAPFAT